MIRNPSLNITKEDLIKVVAQLQLRKNIPANLVVDEIFNKAQEYQITDAYKAILNLKAKTKKKVKKDQEVNSELPKGAVEIFNKLLTSKRIESNPHRIVKPILKTNKQYALLKDIALLAYNFCGNFNLSIDRGFTEFIHIGLGCMRKYGLNRFKTYETNIYEKYESALDVQKDDNPEATALVYEIWRELMVEYTAIEEIPYLKKDPVKYVHLLYARRQAEELDADYVTWMQAQFEGLAFLDVIPDLPQFYGDNAAKRYDRFLNQDVAEQEDDNSLINMYKGASNG